MKNLWKKPLSLVVALMLLLSVSGCGSPAVSQEASVGPTVQASNEGTQAATPEPSPSETPVEAVAEPVRIKVYAASANVELPDDIQTQPLVQALQEKTNVILDVEFFDTGKYRDMVNMKFAAGEYPDVYQAWNIAGEVAYENGLVEDLSSLVDQYGPNLKKNIAASGFDAMTVQGKLWAIPSSPRYNIPSGTVIFVRKDWMDHAGVTTMPKTSDDLLDLWRAFRDSDPNGNGVNDEIPFTAREKFDWTVSIFGMWGIGIQENYVLEDGNLMYCFASQHFPSALEFLATAYQEGLMDSEFLTNTREIWTNKIEQNRVGSWNSVVALAPDWQHRLSNANPDTQGDLFMAIPTPQGKGYSGPVGVMESPMGTCHMIFKDSSEEVKIAAVKMFDYLATEEGAILSAYGLEGDTLVRNADGTYTFDTEKMKANKTEWFKSALGKTEMESVRSMIKSLDPKMDTALEQAIAIGRKEGIPNYIVPMPAPAALVSNPEISFKGPIIQECISKIVLGEEPISHYYEELEKWKKAGGDALIQEVQAWYTANH